MCDTVYCPLCRLSPQCAKRPIETGLVAHAQGQYWPSTLDEHGPVTPGLGVNQLLIAKGVAGNGKILVCLPLDLDKDTIVRATLMELAGGMEETRTKANCHRSPEASGDL